MMNEHVFLYYRALCLWAEAENRHFEQWYYFTLSMRERNPAWTAD
jgi:hypothetical protein